jgi:tetratricopeptide (TPR) repeat protein
MSYINDALRKAQKEKDGRYERFGAIIAPCPEKPDHPGKRGFVLGAGGALLIVVPVGLFLVFYGLYRPSFVKEGIPVPVIEGPPVALRSAVPLEAKETAVGGAVSSRPRTGGTAVPEGPVIGSVQTGGKPAPPAAAVVPVEAPRLREAEAMYQEALSAQRRGDPKEAEILYRKVTALDPGHVRALNNLGVLCLGQKRREQAIALFSRAIVLKKDYVDPYYNLACLYAQTNDVDESLWYLKVAMTIDGDVKNWVVKDADMKSVLASPAFKKIMEGKKN